MSNTPPALTADGHSVKRSDGSTYAVADTAEIAQTIVSLLAERAALREALRVAIETMMGYASEHNKSPYCFRWLVEPLEPCDCAICQARKALALATNPNQETK